MALGRTFRIYHNLNEPPPYSLLVEQRNLDTNLLLESQAIVSLSPVEIESQKKSKNYAKLTDAYGLLGVLKVTAGEGVLHYLALVTGCVSVGKLGQVDIYRVTDVKLLSLRGYNPDEERVSEVRKLLTSGSAYFSWSNSGQNFDLTLSYQKAAKYTKSDNRFFWNRMLHLPFVRAGIPTQPWLLRLMVGSIEIRTVYVGAKQAKAAIISRLSSERAGTRFAVRGVNDDGHVANFVESEQVVQIDEEVSAFLQIRGSVPLFWEQPGLNVGSHKIKMGRGAELSFPAFESHFKNIKTLYGNQVVVNLLGSSLVGSKEGEATLSIAYQTHHKNSPSSVDIPHILFDFHAEGGHKKLDKLKTKVSKYLEKLECFHRKGLKVNRNQVGTVRTNCTDCLDRTNSVQLFLGLEILPLQLADLELGEKPNVVARFEDAFKQMWVNNGNTLSKMYAGTGALCSGGSKILDGARSAARTIQNNLLDSSKQEAIDLLLQGTGHLSEYADRARILLPRKYLHAPVPMIQSIAKRWPEFTYNENLRIACGTYNVNGGKHFRSVVHKDVSLADWLLDAHTKPKNSALINLSESSRDTRKVDIYAIGFEEMVDLDAKNIMNASSENAKAWAVELTKILNRDEKFCLVTFQQLVGVCLYVFVRPEHAPFIRDVAVDDVKTGMGGATGNKGAVAISLTFKATSMCFVCSHFAAGQKQISERNNDYEEASKKIFFPTGRTMFSHDYVFWCGDFNYRIDMTGDEVKEAVLNQDWEQLLSADQLKNEHGTGNVFHDFIEGAIDFAPTYKYDLFSEDYDTSEKSRVPAWTDRVLFRRRKPGGELPEDWTPGQVYFYGRAELKQSDHRPIIAVIDIQLRVVNPANREMIIEEVLDTMGPPDATVIATRVNGVRTLLSEDIINDVTEKMEEFGKVFLSRQVRGSVWVTYREGGAVPRRLSAMSSTDSYSSGGDVDSGKSTPTNQSKREVPPVPPGVPKRGPPPSVPGRCGPPSGPPPGPPPARPPPGPPPALPGRPPAGPPPPLPRR